MNSDLTTNIFNIFPFCIVFAVVLKPKYKIGSKKLVDSENSIDFFYPEDPIKAKSKKVGKTVTWSADLVQPIGVKGVKVQKESEERVDLNKGKSMQTEPEAELHVNGICSVRQQDACTDTVTRTSTEVLGQDIDQCTVDTVGTLLMEERAEYRTSMIGTEVNEPAKDVTCVDTDKCIEPSHTQGDVSVHMNQADTLQDACFGIAAHKTFSEVVMEKDLDQRGVSAIDTHSVQETAELKHSTTSADINVQEESKTDVVPDEGTHPQMVDLTEVNTFHIMDQENETTNGITSELECEMPLDTDSLHRTSISRSSSESQSIQQEQFDACTISSANCSLRSKKNIVEIHFAASTSDCENTDNGDQTSSDSETYSEEEDPVSFL